MTVQYKPKSHFVVRHDDKLTYCGRRLTAVARTVNPVTEVNQTELLISQHAVCSTCLTAWRENNDEGTE